MSNRHYVRDCQGEEVARIARAKGVTRQEFQSALDDGRFAKFLDSLKNSITIELSADARIYTLPNFTYIQDVEWQEAIDAGCPNTPDYSNARKVSDYYMPIGTGEVQENLVLINYPNGGGSWDRAIAWAEDVGLKRTVPREVFAIGEKYPNLSRELKCNWVCVAATTECILLVLSRLAM